MSEQLQLPPLPPLVRIVFKGRIHEYEKSEWRQFRAVIDKSLRDDPDLRFRVIDFVASAFGYTAENLIGKSRAQPIVRARQAAMVLLAGAFPEATATEITSVFGQDHGMLPHNRSLIDAAPLGEQLKIDSLRGPIRELIKQETPA